MYKCNACGAVFTDPAVEHVEERHGELGTPASGYFKRVGVIETCPYCGSDEYFDGEECPICGTVHDGVFSDYCDECTTAVTEAVEALEKKLGTSWQKTVDLVGDWYERNF